MGHEFAGRLVWEEKVRRYPAVVDAAYAVRHLPVWPGDRGGDGVSLDALYAELVACCVRVRAQHLRSPVMPPATR